MDDNGKFFIKGFVPKPILEKYDCFGFGYEHIECNFVKKMNVLKNGITPGFMTQKYTLLHIIKVISIRNTQNKKWVQPDIKQSLKDLVTSISHAPRRHRRSFKHLLSKISQNNENQYDQNNNKNLLKMLKKFGRGQTRGRSSFDKLLSKISPNYGSKRMGYGNLLSKVPTHQRRRFKNLLTKISNQFGRQNNRRLNKLITKIYDNQTWNPKSWLNY